VIFVRHDNTLQVNSRLVGTSAHPASPDTLRQFLDENLSLFDIMVEEDPEYHQLRILQDAGIIPVIQPATAAGQRHGGYGALPQRDMFGDDQQRERIERDRQLRER
jgi:hypothetical protein